MSFYETLFPTDISYGSAGGIGFRTVVLPLDSGHEVRFSRWSSGRHRYDVSYGIKTWEQLTTLKNFFVSMQGAAHGFRFKDFLDCTTAGTSVALELSGDAPAHDDEVLVEVEAGLKYQLVKRYSEGTVTRVRNISKPVGGTVRIGVNGVDTGSGWSVDTTTGIITFGADQTGNAITGGCEFDVPCRFGETSDEALKAAISEFETGGINTPVEIVEILDTGPATDDMFFGGAVELSISENTTLALGNGRLQVIDATATGLDIDLPDPTDLPTGWPLMVVVNIGSNTFTLRDHLAATVMTMGSNDLVELGITLDSGGSKIWMGAGR